MNDPGSKQNTESVDSPFVTFKIEESVVYVIYKNVTIDLVAANEIGRIRREFLKGRSYPGLADARAVKLVTNEARKHLIKEATLGPKESGVTAIAVLVGSRLTVFMANLFIRFVKSKIPTKVFITREQALKWLDQFKDRAAKI